MQNIIAKKGNFVFFSRGQHVLSFHNRNFLEYHALQKECLDETLIPDREITTQSDEEKITVLDQMLNLILN